MPPKKVVDQTKVATGDEGTPAKETFVKDGVNIEDLNLPKSIVTRLAKGVLPPNTQIQGNAILAMTKSATVFVNYLATHANEHAQRSGKKTILPQDIFFALEDLEFPDFRPRLEAELAKFVELQTDKRNTYRKKVAADKASGKVGSEVEGEEESFVEGEGGPARKRVRVDEGVPERNGEDREGEEEEPSEGEEPEPEEDEEEDGEEGEEHREAVEELGEEGEEGERDDEALDNGEDSD